MRDLPTLSIVMPIRNEGRHIRAALEALLRQEYPPELVEVIVVDGDSDDDTPAIVQAVIDEHPDRAITLLHNPRRIVPISLNLGIRASRGEVIVRMDGHAHVADNYLFACVRTLEETGADNVGGPIETVGTTTFGRALAVAQSSPLGIGASPFRYSDRPAEVATVPFGAFRRSCLERTGLFDESMIRNQDYEMNVRIRATGGRIWLDPRIRSRYTARSSPKALWHQYFDYGWYRAETLRRHPRSMRPNHVLPLGLAATLTLPVPALRNRWIRRGWLAAVGTYGTYLGVSTAMLRERARGRELAGVPVALTFMQYGYGLGSLVNVLTLGRWPHPRAIPTVPDLPPLPDGPAESFASTREEVGVDG